MIHRDTQDIGGYIAPGLDGLGVKPVQLVTEENVASPRRVTQKRDSGYRLSDDRGYFLVLAACAAALLYGHQPASRRHKPVDIDPERPAKIYSIENAPLTPSKPGGMGPSGPMNHGFLF